MLSSKLILFQCPYLRNPGRARLLHTHHGRFLIFYLFILYLEPSLTLKSKVIKLHAQLVNYRINLKKTHI